MVVSSKALCYGFVKGAAIDTGWAFRLMDRSEVKCHVFVEVVILGTHRPPMLCNLKKWLKSALSDQSAGQEPIWFHLDSL